MLHLLRQSTRLCYPPHRATRVPQGRRGCCGTPERRGRPSLQLRTCARALHRNARARTVATAAGPTQSTGAGPQRRAEEEEEEEEEESAAAPTVLTMMTMTTMMHPCCWFALQQMWCERCCSQQQCRRLQACSTRLVVRANR